MAHLSSRSRKGEQEVKETPLNISIVYGNSRDEIMKNALAKGREVFGTDHLNVKWDSISQATVPDNGGKYYAYKVVITEACCKAESADTFTEAEIDAAVLRLSYGTLAKKIVTAIRENRILDAHRPF